MSRPTPSSSSGPRALHLLESPVTPASPSPAASLARAHVLEALHRSTDGGATLDLARLGLADVGEEGAQELASLAAGRPVVRSAHISAHTLNIRLTRAGWRSASTGSRRCPWRSPCCPRSGISIFATTTSRPSPTSCVPPAQSCQSLTLIGPSAYRPPFPRDPRHPAQQAPHVSLPAGHAHKPQGSTASPWHAI
jgi:hypothetical protein